MIGYDLAFLKKYGMKVPIEISPLSHLCIVGSSGSGKSTAVLYMVYKMQLENKVRLTICDFKKSSEFLGITPSINYAEFEECYEMICKFYNEFISADEGGSAINILIIDEIAGLLSHFSMVDKKKAEEIKQMMSSILMLGRSRQYFLWLSMQRFSATIFPGSSGAADNFHVCIGLGRLTVDGRRSLFAGEHLTDGEDIQFGQGKGIVLIDGEPLKALVIPKISKQKTLGLLQKSAEGVRSTP